MSVLDGQLTFREAKFRFVCCSSPATPRKELTAVPPISINAYTEAVSGRALFRAQSETEFVDCRSVPPVRIHG